MSSFIVPVLIKVATDSSVIKASWKVLIGFCQTTLHMSPQTQRHAVTAMFVSSHQHPILQFSCDVRSAEEKLVIWTSCRERGTFLWEVSGINVSGRSPTGRYWKTGCSRMRAMKREPGAVKEEWVLCWESGWWVCDAEGAALNQCYSHWGHFKCFSVEIQFLVTSEDVSSVAVYSICSIFSDVERNCWRKLSENGSAARCCPCGVSMLSHLWEIFVCSDVRTQNMFVLYMNETVRQVSGVYWSPSSQHMLLETKSYSW